MSKEKLESFVSDLNGIVASSELFDKKEKGRFTLETKDVGHLIGVAFGFKEGDKHHVFYVKKLIFEAGFNEYETQKVNSFYHQCYLELLRLSILAEDFVGEFKDEETGNSIVAMLSFKTLINEGLNKLNK